MNIYFFPPKSKDFLNKYPIFVVHNIISQWSSESASTSVADIFVCYCLVIRGSVPPRRVLMYLQLHWVMCYAAGQAGPFFPPSLLTL